MNIKNKSFLILLLIISSFFFYVRNYKIKEGKRGRRWVRRAGRFAKRAGRSIRRAGNAAARAAQRNAALQAARRAAVEAARQRQIRAMRRALAAAARRAAARAREAARVARAVTKMNNKYEKIKQYCSSDGINCDLVETVYDNARNAREKKCKKSIRSLKKHCLNNSSIITKSKCRKVLNRNWRRNQKAKIPRLYDYECNPTTG